MEALLDLTGYTQYGDAGLGGTCPAWMTARGRRIVLDTISRTHGWTETGVHVVLARLAAGAITRDQAATQLAA